MQISATIITFNEESNIKAACESVAWADEIVVVDSNSTDKTRDIAGACGARVITNEWPGFGAQKQFAVNRAKHDWIFSLDADERVSDRLRTSLELLKNHPRGQDADGYVVAQLVAPVWRETGKKAGNKAGPRQAWRCARESQGVR